MDVERTLTGSVYSSFLQPQEAVQIHKLRRNAILAANCVVLANYNTAGVGNYYTDQIKVDWDRHLLVDTSSFDISNQFSKLSMGWVEPYTELHKTVIILNEVCQAVFQRAKGYGQCLSTMEEKPKNLIDRYKKLTAIALMVFHGLNRMMSTYTLHYNEQNQQKAGYPELKKLFGEVAEWGTELWAIYSKIMSGPCKLGFNEHSEPICTLSTKVNHSNIVYEEVMTLQDINRYLILDQQYYESLHHLCIYDPQGTSDYTYHQIKACDKTVLLVLTGFWSTNNWLGDLTPLDRTVIVLKKHCERAKIECAEFFDYFAKADAVDAEFKAALQDDVDQIIGGVIPGIKRMAKTYQKKYGESSTHPGLQELRVCSQSLNWSENMKTDDL